MRPCFFDVDSDDRKRTVSFSPLAQIGATMATAQRPPAAAAGFDWAARSASQRRELILVIATSTARHKFATGAGAGGL